MRLLYKITDQMFLHFYTFNVEKVRKCFTFLFLLYLFFFFNCSYCEYSVQYEQNNEQATFSDSSLKEQKRYNLSELSGDNTLKNEEKILESEELTQKQNISFMTPLFKEQEEQRRLQHVSVLTIYCMEHTGLLFDKFDEISLELMYRESLE